MSHQASLDSYPYRIGFLLKVVPSMGSTHDNRFLISGWGISLTFHAVAIGLAMAFLAKIDPSLKKETFHWEVALVEAPAPAPAAKPEPVVTPVQPKARPTPPPPAPVPVPETPVYRVAPQESAQMVHPVIEASKPVEQKIEPVPQQRPEPIQRRVEVVEQKVEPVVQRVEESPAVEEKPAEHMHADTVVAQHRPIVPVEAPAPAPPVQEVAIASPSPAPVADAPAPPAPAAEATLQQSTPVESEQMNVASAPAPAPVETPQVTAKAATGMPETKADHRWLAESLWRRVAELKRYPHSARMNGLQGKVVLKAVIRSDGHLAEVTVQKSSGHSVLDAAAMEAVKLACPLHMKHELGKPQIVVSLPIVYSLAN
jgi:protein TonB